MSAAAVIPSLIPLFIAIAIRRAETRIHRRLEEAHATTAESAIELPIDGSMERKRLQRLIEGGAVRVTPDGRHFLDVDGWNRHRSDQRRRVELGISIGVALLVVITAALLLFMQ